MLSEVTSLRADDLRPLDLPQVAPSFGGALRVKVQWASGRTGGGPSADPLDLLAACLSLMR